MTGQETILQFLEEIKTEIIQNHIKAGQDVTGNAIRSYEIITEEFGGKLLAAPYVFALDKGRGPSKKSGSGDQSLQSSILEWMKAKGINAVPYSRKDGSLQDQDKADKGLSFAIANNIHENGTLAFRNGGTGVISNVITERRLQIFADVFAGKYLATMQSEVLKGFKK